MNRRVWRVGQGSVEPEFLCCRVGRACCSSGELVLIEISRLSMMLREGLLEGRVVALWEKEAETKCYMIEQVDKKCHLIKRKLKRWQKLGGKGRLPIYIVPPAE